MNRFVVDIRDLPETCATWANHQGVYLLSDADIYTPVGLTNEDLVRLFVDTGFRFLSQLNGKYVFLLYDSRSKKLHIVRDRAGECAVYYFKGRVCNYLCDLNTTFEWESHRRGRQNTHWKHVYQVPPANIMTIDLATGRWQFRTYWSVGPAPSKAAPIDVLAEQLRDVLTDAIRIRCQGRYAVVCGGLDTSIIATATSPSIIYSFDNDFSPELTDVPYVKELSKELGANVYWAHGGKPEFHQIMPSLIVDTDILLPFNGGHLFHFQVGRKIREVEPSVQRVLTGTGGDELFGTMRIGILAHEIRLYDNTHYSGWHKLLDDYYGNHVFRLAKLMNVDSSLVQSFAKYCDRSDAIGAAHRFVFNHLVPLESLMLRKSFIRNDLETASPFLDHRVLDLAFSYDKRLDYADGAPKYLLRYAFKNILPTAISSRTHKVGHSLPVREWLGKEGIVEYSKRILLSSLGRKKTRR